MKPTPRWVPVDKSIRARYVFIGYAGDLDVYMHPKSDDHLAIVYSDSRGAMGLNRFHNHSTAVHRNGEITIPETWKVRPELYEMCRIYKLYEEYINGR